MPVECAQGVGVTGPDEFGAIIEADDEHCPVVVGSSGVKFGDEVGGGPTRVT
jgi:hypothetical protein